MIWSCPTRTSPCCLNTWVAASTESTWKAITGTFAIDNLFDSHYEQYVGFEQPGIRARAMLTARF